MFTRCQLGVSSPARRESKVRKKAEAVGKSRRVGKKCYWTRWGSVTSIASQTGPQISRARSGAAWEPTAGAPRAMPPGD